MSDGSGNPAARVHLSSAGMLVVAAACHAANAAFCRYIGDDSQVAWDEAPEWQRSSAINGVQFRLDNPDLPDSASHDNWMAEKVADGWVYGEVKDPEKKAHPCLVPYDQLPEAQRFKDALFSSIVREVAPSEFGMDEAFSSVSSERDEAIQKLGDANRQLAEVTAERDALSKAASAAAKAPRSTKVPTVKARKCRAMEDAFDAEDLLALIGDAETVELVFSDGTSEIPSLPARSIEGDAWAVTFAGLALRLPELLIEGPGPGVLSLAGYGLFLDGKQIAWASRPDVLPIPPGARMNLQGDVLFGAG